MFKETNVPEISFFCSWALGVFPTNNTGAIKYLTAENSSPWQRLKQSLSSIDNWVNLIAVRLVHVFTNLLVELCTKRVKGASEETNQLIAA